MVDRVFKLNVGGQGFGSVNPEIRIIEGWIIEVLLYTVACGTGFNENITGLIISLA